PFICGGAQIYAATLDQVTRIYATEIDAEHAGDTYFPAINDDQWHEVSREVDGILTFRVLERRDV
ncbi:MAG: dihydrofolate reductase, partial [Planctomycetota bacterium]